jgi:hypothetical protein
VIEIESLMYLSEVLAKSGIRSVVFCAVIHFSVMEEEKDPAMDGCCSVAIESQQKELTYEWRD